MSVYGAFEATVVTGAVLAAVAYAGARWWPRRRAGGPGCHTGDETGGTTGCGSGCSGCGQASQPATGQPQVVHLVRRR
jgi:hypothetical protein